MEATRAKFEISLVQSVSDKFSMDKAEVKKWCDLLQTVMSNPDELEDRNRL